MSDTSAEIAPSLVIDVRGLKDWSDLSENEAGAIADLYYSGQLMVPTQAWNEFTQAYPSCAEKLDVPKRMRVTQAHRLAAAELASEAPISGLPTSARPGDFCVAGIAKETNCSVVTNASQKRGLYNKLSVTALTIADLLEGGA